MTDQVKTTSEQQKQAEENARKKLADQKSAREATAASAPDPGKPTPTQEENDLAALGVHVSEHEADGSPVQDPSAPQDKMTKQSEAKKPVAQTGGYQTRATKPADA